MILGAKLHTASETDVSLAEKYVSNQEKPSIWGLYCDIR
jgi:hypothetical protein